MTADLTARYLDAIRKSNNGLSTRLADELDATGHADEARLTSPRALLSAAVWYVRQGVAVFPCTPRAKTPHGGLVPRTDTAPGGLHRATVDEAQVIAWWTACPDANIGAPTGLTFDVVDIDGREGVLSVYGPADDGRRPADDLDPIGHALTPRDGGHHVFIAPTGRGNTTQLLPGVDYRGAGGYVLLAPSVGANGRRYRWTRPLVSVTS